MSYARLAMRLYNTPLLITAEKLDVIDHVFRAHEDGRAKLLAPFEQKSRPEVAGPGQAQRTQSGYIRTADGVAIIPIIGTLVQRSGGMDAESGLTSYSEIGAQLAAAMSDPQVRGLLLEVDSSGGEVNGIFDLAAEMRAAASIKPMTAHVNEEAFSGGYVLASAAQDIYTPRTGMVGSIGVRMRHVDQSRYDAKRGLTYTDVVFGDKKVEGSPHAPLSDSAYQFMQDHVDRVGKIFVDHVAEMRGIDAQTVIDTQAGILHADEALAAGLIDGVATISDALESLRGRMNAPNNYSTYGLRAAADAPLSNAQIEELFMSDAPKGAAPNPVAVITPEQVTDARTAGVAEGKTAGIAEGVKTGAEAERARVSGILTHAEAAGRGKLAEHLAFKTASTVEDAAALLAVAPKESAAAQPSNLLAAHMATVPNPKVGASADEGEETVESVAARILAAGRQTKLKAVK